jgi:carbon dioxide concentrating mechanism protein CcmM
VCIAAIRDESNGHSDRLQWNNSDNGHQRSLGLDVEASAWIRTVLSQGFHIGVEKADARRFRANSWSDCGLIKTTQAVEAIAALEKCLDEHRNQYIRLFGINPKTRQRGSELMIQHPKKG